MLPTTQFAYRKGLGTCDALLCVAHTLQNALEMRQEARIIQINFSAAFDRVNHEGIHFKLCSVGVGGSVLSDLTQFLSNQSHRVVMDGCRSKLVNMVSGVPQGCLVHCRAFPYSENKLHGYADDSTLVDVVPSPGERVAISESMNRDQNRVSVWCNLWGMKLNSSKTKTMIGLQVTDS